MIVSYESQFAFFKTIKTASTSVEIFLSRYCGPDDIITYLPDADEAIRRELGYRGPQNCYNSFTKQMVDRILGRERYDRRHRFHHNMKVAEARKAIAPDTWRKMLKFTIVRNPFDRAISKFYHDHKDNALDKQYKGEEYSRRYINEYILDLPDTDLTNWHIYTDKDEIIVDEVIRYESLKTDLSRLLQRLNVDDPVDLPRAKGNWRTNRSHYSLVLGEDVRERIEAVAGKEVETFGYTWQQVAA